MGVLGEGGTAGGALPAIDDQPSVTAATPAGPGSQLSATLPAHHAAWPFPKEGGKICLY